MNKLIHKSACAKCPSVISGDTDAESNEIKTYPKELIAKEFLFVCYKRPDKLCKGLCDKMGINQQFLNNLK